MSFKIWYRTTSFYTIIQVDNKVKKSKIILKEFFDYNVSNLYCISKIRRFWEICKFNKWFESFRSQFEARLQQSTWETKEQNIDIVLILAMYPWYSIRGHLESKVPKTLEIFKGPQTAQYPRVNYTSIYHKFLEIWNCSTLKTTWERTSDNTIKTCISIIREWSCQMSQLGGRS